ncbi:SMC-Scp complex subunit ScpB [Candidatus Margulisiibacteriota bacterium]
MKKLVKRKLSYKRDDIAQVKNELETLLFVSNEPMLIEKMSELLETDSKQIREVLQLLQDEYQDRAMQIIEVAGGYQLSTRKEFDSIIKKVHETARTQGIPPASMEVLAIVAYKQPITRNEIEFIRGVDSTSSLKWLEEKDLVEEAGKSHVPGHPMLFKTTKKFLSLFGLTAIDQLPSLKEDFLKEHQNQSMLPIKFAPQSG